jgi:malate dehydrogenase
MGVPAVLGANGVERILELRLNAAEFEALQKSADAVREQLAALGGRTSGRASIRIVLK